MFLKRNYLTVLLFVFIKFQVSGQAKISKVVFDFSNHPNSDTITIVILRNSSFFQSSTAILPQTVLDLNKPGNYKAYFNSSKGNTSSVEWTLPSEETIAFKIQMKEKVIDLMDLEIKVEKNRFKNKGDTLVINTENLKTKPNGDASEIFEKIGGLYQDLSGNVSVKGIKVASITIDGKKIYGGNTTLTLKNIRADMIKEMHFTKKQLSSGNMSGHIELKLRDDRKKGFFGELDQKLSPEIEKYGSLVKGTSLKGNGIFNIFAQNNNINDLNLGQVDNEGNTVKVRTEIFANSTLMGLYGVDFPSPFEETSDEKIIDVQKGLNQISNAGMTYSFEKKKWEGNVFSLLRGFEKSITQKTENEIYSLSLSQNKLSVLEENQLQKIFQSQSNFNYKPNRKTIIWGSLDLSLSKSQATLNDSTSIIQQTQNIIYETEKQKNDTKNGIGILAGYYLKGQKRGAKNLIFLNYQIGNQNIRYLGKYLQLNQTNLFKNQVNYENTDLEVIKSIPIGKRFVFEPKIIYINEIKKNNSDSKYFYQNITYNLLNYYFYQGKRFNISTGLGYRYNKSFRQNQIVKNQQNDTYFGLQLININLQKILLGKGILSYSNTLKNPYTRDVIFPSDSSDIYSILRTNPTLEPSIENKVSYFQFNDLQKGWSMQANFIFSDIKNPTIFNQSINEKAIGLFVPTNGSRNNNEIRFNLLLMKNPGLKSKYYDFSIDFISTKNNYILNSEEIFFSNNNFGLNHNLKWKIGKMQNLKSEIKINYSSNNISNFFSAQLNSKLNLELPKKIYTDLIINTNYYSFGSILPLLNLNFQKYFSQTDKISVGFSVINILNFKENYSGQISNIQRFTSSYSILPRTLLLRVSIYPQLWKR